MSAPVKNKPYTCFPNCIHFVCGHVFFLIFVPAFTYFYFLLSPNAHGVYKFPISDKIYYFGFVAERKIVNHSL